MELRKIDFSCNNSIASVVLNYPKNLNALDMDMVDELLYVLKKCEEDDSVKVVVISGGPKAFSAGGDIGYFYKEMKSGNLDLDPLIAKAGSISLAIKKMLKPVISSVSGAVAGAGFNLAISCDFCIAANNTKFIQAFVNIGLIPDTGGVYLLTRAIGVQRALDLIMTGRVVSADEAYSLGLVKEVCAPEDLQKRTMEFAAKLAHGPLLAYANNKKLIFSSEYMDYERFLKDEVTAQSACAASEDFREGISAFVEKRKPSFKGR
ncbi:enoyl-CoA hydratase/isomerase family protein [Clostridium bovifaecis]|uniref:Enoyl-CoA hydratase/isomerase family protein n=1 Tax=Clostridium bovifaecis TaxID=2184719 RepID=A0A6I6F027_9CLOT|nr:enoyl-CoA hydratase/isomerase family protein [Clostridium bovifaecis]